MQRLALERNRSRIDRVTPTTNMSRKIDLMPMPVVYPFDRDRVGSIPFFVTTLDEAAKWLVQRAISPGDGPIAIRLANAWCVALADSEVTYKKALQSPDSFVFPDGAPVVWALKAAGNRGAGRVRGPSLFREVIDIGRDHGVRHYFLGSTEQTLEAMVETIRYDYPEAIVAGTFAPPFGPVTSDLIDDAVQRISSTSANIVWVGMGTPKQDDVSSRLARQLLLPVAGVGAAFDFLAGTTSEAPAWVQRSGFEWLYRLASEPRRLWKRYLIGNVRFVAAVLRHWKADRRAK